MTEMTTHGTMTSASDSAAQVQEYVSAVRAALSDLSLEEVEDLTAGMDADLGELLAERGGTLEVALGSPQAYAAELRTAAGLPAAAGPGRRTISLGDWSRAWSERVSVQMQRRPWLAGLLRGLVAIRPAWWVLRGLIAAWAVAGILGLQSAALVPRDARMLVLSILGVTGSVALARGPQGSAVTRSLVGLGNALAILLLLPAMGSSQPQVVYEGGGDQGPQPVQGLVFDGRLVENIFGYDASGARVTDVRLFDDEGRSIVLSAEIGGQAAWTGRRDVTGERWTNVYPVPWSSGLDPWVRPFRADENPVWQPPVTMPALGPTVGPTVTSPTTGATTAPTRTGSAGSPSVATSTASGTASGPSGVGSTSTSTSSAPTGSRAP